MKKSMMIICTILFLFGCAEKNDEHVETETIIDKSITSSQNEFAWKLYEEVAIGEENTFISPYIVFMALAMTINGADGETQKEMMRTLEVEEFPLKQLNKDGQQLMEQLEKEGEKITFQTANALWLNDEYTFAKPFMDAVAPYYDAEARAVDMADIKTVDEINDWVKDHTNGKIDEIVEAPLDTLIVTMLMNAVYFDGAWQHEFLKDGTMLETFYGKEETEVEMMIVEEEFAYTEDDVFELVQLPYGEGEMSMYVLLPKEGEEIGLLTYEQFSLLKDTMISMDGTVKLPKFTMEDDLLLDDALISLGMEKAFDREEADFSKIVTEDAPLWIDFVRHKTFIDVHEEGTEAAAVTNVGIKTMAAIDDDETFYFEANRPFQFIIMDEATENILFIGKVGHIEK